MQDFSLVFSLHGPGTECAVNLRLESKAVQSMKSFLKYLFAQYLIVLILFAITMVLAWLDIGKINIGYAGYSWPVIIDCTYLSLKLLGIGILFTLIINTLAISFCSLTIKWYEEITQTLEVFFQIISCVPLFVACLYLRKLGISADLVWGGLVLAVGDFLLAELFPLLNLK